MKSAKDYAKDHEASCDYLASRRADVDTLMAQGIRSLPYAKVNPADAYSKRVMVNDVVCETPLCAVAYILAAFW